MNGSVDFCWVYSLIRPSPIRIVCWYPPLVGNGAPWGPMGPHGPPPGKIFMCKFRAKFSCVSSGCSTCPSWLLCLLGQGIGNTISCPSEMFLGLSLWPLGAPWAPMGTMRDPGEREDLKGHMANPRNNSDDQQTEQPDKSRRHRFEILGVRFRGRCGIYQP